MVFPGRDRTLSACAAHCQGPAAERLPRWGASVHVSGHRVPQRPRRREDAPTGRAQTRAFTDASCAARESHHGVECEGGSTLPPRGCALGFVPFKDFRAISSALLMARGCACERGERDLARSGAALGAAGPWCGDGASGIGQALPASGTDGAGCSRRAGSASPRASCGSPARWNGGCGARWGCGPRCTRSHPSGACGCPCRWRSTSRPTAKAGGARWRAPGACWRAVHLQGPDQPGWITAQATRGPELPAGCVV